VGLLENIQKNIADNPILINSEAAFSKFLELGFPDIKNEEWKYTSLKKVISYEYEIEKNTEEISNKEIKSNSLNFHNAIIFLNGKIYSKPDIKGVTISNFEDKNPSFDNAITALNASTASNGYSISVDSNTVVSEPIEILFLTKNSSNNFIQYRNNINVEENSEVKIVEHIKNLSDKICLTNSVTLVKLKKYAKIEHNKLQDNNDNQISIDHTYVDQDKNSISTINTLIFGGLFTRNNLNFTQNGERGESNMNGIVILDNKEFADNHTFMDHKMPNCESNELYKGIYLGRAKGVFNGKIMVQPDAQKINAFQANNNLLLSDNSSINSKPQLEIYADDVKCSHGCTIGQLDENALFYMNTRGISKEDAKAILTFAFASEALDKITIKELSSLARDLMSKKLNVNLSF
tara:strand:+ start:11245 stop:12462 length:1218 start_codon:yes stop_codon:yes gene_type:complete